MQLSDVSHPVWRKSTRSNGAGGDCVEVADLAVGIGVRDSKAPEAGHLTYAPEAWVGFTAQVKAGRYDWDVDGSA
ncbi:DUF397 domain-containing protein [Actinomadura latina]|uniref:DUF397 domain-containing protein n=1 Tax=Actinomadura latina TaxID=163603 RepID=A0A846YTF3_9ACTN|nr:DUF397 domain-containing protein [Actinomadura latina]NKZ03027.1 DUF397 domain-containing protein [Actinomadura latina]